MQKKLIKIIISLLLFLITLIINFENKYINGAIYVIAYIIVGFEIIKKAIRNIIKGKVFDENFLMAVATLGAFVIGEYPEAVAVMLFYQVGELFQSYAVDKSRKSITELMDIKPEYANVERNKEIQKIKPEDVKIGEIIIVKPGEKIPKIRLGHGLYTPELTSEKGKEIINKIKKAGAVLEFQLTSNVRLNNLSNIEKHPIKTYLENNIKCVQGTDGCGFYGIDTIDEQLALQNLLKLNDKDFEQMRKVETQIIEESERYFEQKTKKFNEFLNGRTIKEAILAEEEKNEKESQNKKMPLRIRTGIDAQESLRAKIKDLPTDKLPIIIAGGSFNAQNRETIITEQGKKILEELIKKVNNEKAYFVIGHKMQGFEKAIVDISKKMNKKFEIDAIVPKIISEENSEELINENVDKIRISTENEASGIYKSFNYEIFERRSSVVVAFDGNSPVSNLVQEAKNGKGKSKIYVNEENTSLREKAKSLKGYVIPFSMDEDIVDKIIKENPDIA